MRCCCALSEVAPNTRTSSTKKGQQRFTFLSFLARCNDPWKEAPELYGIFFLSEVTQVTEDGPIREERGVAGPNRQWLIQSRYFRVAGAESISYSVDAPGARCPVSKVEVAEDKRSDLHAGRLLFCRD